MEKSVYERTLDHVREIERLLAAEKRDLAQDLTLGIATAISGMEAILAVYQSPMLNSEIVSSAGKSRYLDVVALNACMAGAVEVAAREKIGIDFRSENNFDSKTNQGEIIKPGRTSRVILVDQLDGTSNTAADPRGFPLAATVICVAPQDKATFRGATVGVVAQLLANGLAVYVGIRLEKSSQTFIIQQDKVEKFSAYNTTSRRFYLPSYSFPAFAPTLGMLEHLLSQDPRTKDKMKFQSGTGASAPDLRLVIDSDCGGYIDLRSAFKKISRAKGSVVNPYDVAGALLVLEGSVDDEHEVYILNEGGCPLDFPFLPYGENGEGISVIALRIPKNNSEFKKAVVEICQQLPRIADKMTKIQTEVNQ